MSRRRLRDVAPNYDALASYAADDPTGYLTDVPAAVRQLSEARSAAQTAAEVYSRNRVARNFDALGSGITDLPHPDADPETLRTLLQLQSHDRQAADQKAMAERVDTYGTPYSYEARNREAEGGVYRDDKSMNAMLRHDPAALLAELQGQQPGPPLDASGDLGGTFSVLGTGDPRDAARQQRLAELLGLTQTTAREAATKHAKESPEDKAARTFSEDLAYSKAAKDQGVDTIVAAIRERAAKEPRFAIIAPRLIQQLKNRRAHEKDIIGALADNPYDVPKGAKPILGPDNTLLEDVLPPTATAAEMLRKLKAQRDDEELTRAAERGYWRPGEHGY